MLICPVCSGALVFEPGGAVCSKGHRFDMAKEGYVNLLRTNKSGDKIGDDKLAARCRRDFLNKGYYTPLQAALTELFRTCSGSVLDICCGEGYYGFDISKEMVRLGAKRGGATYFVANMAAIPVADNSFDYCTHLFAPFHEKEFARVLKPGGTLYTVIPGSHHLWGLKEAVYETPYVNDEQLPQTQLLQLVSVNKVTASIHLENPEDIEAVFRMTPYYFHTSPADRDKLKAYSTLDTPIEFVIGQFQKPL